MATNQHILLTIDVEDWFQVENFKPWIPFETWDQRELRVERNVHRLLDLLDSVEATGELGGWNVGKQEGDKAQRLGSEKAKSQEAEIGDQTAEDTACNKRELKTFRRRRIDSNHFHPRLQCEKRAGMVENDSDNKKSPKSCPPRSSGIWYWGRSCLPSEIRKTFHRGLKYELKKNPFQNKTNRHSQAPNTQPHSFPASQLQPTGFEPPSLPTSQLQAKATFFVLGWLSQKLPHLIREIHARGHEVASHGVNHRRCDQLSLAELKKDLSDSKKHLEDILGGPVFGYRAPSFAVNDDILKVIEDAGYYYDSSYNSFSLHGRYGKISLNGTRKKGIAHKISDNFYELPISNLRLAGQIIPWGGGGYFRLAPYRLFRRGVQSILENDGAYAFYLHPWEIDPDQPWVEKASFPYRFKHYTGLNSASEKLHKLIKEFSRCSFITCSCYLELNREL